MNVTTTVNTTALFECKQYSDLEAYIQWIKTDELPEKEFIEQANYTVLQVRDLFTGLGGSELDSSSVFNSWGSSVWQLVSCTLMKYQGGGEM